MADIASHITDPHRNIFYFYRAPRKHNEVDFIHDDQLENNITKALINTLEYCDKHTALTSFLGLLEDRIRITAGKDIHLHMGQRKCQFSLQSIPVASLSAAQKILVTITNASVDTRTSNQQPGSRPDAWITCGSNFAIMIESKIDTLPDENQLKGHLAKVGWIGMTYNRVDLSWEDTYQCFKSLLTTDLGERDSFVTRQFMNYMEVTGMAPFEGFKNSDFDFFLIYEENEDYKPIVKKRLVDFAKIVYARLTPELSRIYCDFYPGRFTKEEFWVAFRKNQSVKSAFRHCNLNLEIGPEGLFWQAVIRDGKAADQDKPIGKLYQKLQDEDHFNNFKTILSGLGAEYSLVIFERTDLSRRRRPMPGADVWNKKAWLSLDYLPNENLKAMVNLLTLIPYPGVIVQKEILKGDHLLWQPEALVVQCVNSLSRLHDVLTFLE
jgi:hypothetical protein